ncbi:outer dynein arm-docking complex subunit 1 [Rhineura floridana]|uniref:outer dynein arm-docking complex subunit 1 n=1 Tax=Rhineura floridana TaxID=261503 RepID=UPI002AC83C29|nr:outer dynein arm-docking complex subunit 1 [Rhineura floridana]XP_061444722.1 outer dynein arm-docking complex subunit 1 [Rhineura floridana]XP_061444723.1 outer dynein arm-docking complex subunit 1 [Rhineura floridana]XP_061444724.1 outer dynein arm-docking complex subunit 1 [Rhineura floridana]XP_061444725.1 outer dynein arm-docking complex subunit 1 [Rhineura floridana]XP_061444726.1 outer dynein arm-docking complex subunit 1 [Rhineura floridana]XP_061444727.1 outer dynein arm-docking c
MPFFKSASSLRSEGSDVDLEGLAESELAKLQRQFRLLEGDRHAYSLESRELIRRQKAEIKRLEKENKDLLHRQTVAEGRANAQQEKVQGDTLRSLLGQQDEVKQQIIQEKKQIAELDKEIQNCQKRLADRKQVTGSGTLIQEQKAHLLKRIETVENQLDRASSEFNSQLIMNSQLREDLEILRDGHDRFEQLYKHLEKELLDTRKAIGAIITTSSAAYDARDEAQTRLGQLQEKAKKDIGQYESEMKELCRLLENDRRMSEFISIKLQERMLTEEALKAKKKKEEESKRKDPEEEMLESFHSTLDQVLELTDSPTLDVALDKYVQGEERNFAQFNYVNEQNNQKEQLWEQINELCREIEEVRKQDAQKDTEQLSRLKEVEAQQEAAVKEANQTELMLKRLCKIWEQLKNEIESVFWKLQCDYSVLENRLGGSTTARDENVAIYLGLIEQKTNDLLAMYSYSIAEEQDQPYDTVETAQFLLGQKPEVQPHPINIRPPTTGPGHEPIAEEDQRPLTQAELKEKILNDILSKAAALSLQKNTQSDIPAERSGSNAAQKQQQDS